jgi:hypothetical protein
MADEIRGRLKPGQETEIISKSGREDRAKGCILGALLGDAVGATLEFYFKIIGPKEVNRAFSLPGGGAHNVGPG